VWGRKGPNDEFRMTKEARNPNENDGATDRILISSFELHSSFVICHSSFSLPMNFLAPAAFAFAAAIPVVVVFYLLKRKRV